MSEPTIRVIAQPRSEPDYKALARAIIEMARLLDLESEAEPKPKATEEADG